MMNLFPMGTVLKVNVTSIICFYCNSILIKQRCPRGCRQRLYRCSLSRCQKYYKFSKCANGRNGKICKYGSYLINDIQCYTVKHKISTYRLINWKIRYDIIKST